MYRITEITSDSAELEKYYAFPSGELFTTKEWLSFIEEDSKVIPLLLKIEENGKTIGYFSSMMTKKYGVNIVGSPFNGWSTCYMGFKAAVGIDKTLLIKDTLEYLYKEKKAELVMIIDRDFKADRLTELGYHATSANTLEMPVNLTDEELFKLFKTDCRNYIRQFERRGATIEIAEPDDGFAENFYAQLTDVFAKQGMVPTYSLEKVKCLLKNLRLNDRVLCLKVTDPDGNCIATSIFPGYENKFYFWGGASYRSGQHYRPNEYMIWTAIKYWREKGAETFDMMGVRDYKRKFGSKEVEYGQIIESKHWITVRMMKIAKWSYFAMLKVKGKIKRRR